MRNNEYARVINNIITFLNKVSATGIEENQRYMESAIFLQEILNGNLTITPSVKEKPKDDSNNEN